MKQAGIKEFRMVGVEDIRDINQTVFLHLIREKQPISRADIAKETGLRAGTVSSIVNRLIRNGLVYEGTEGPSSGGRPPKYLYINAESFYVLAVDIGVTDSVYAVSDFNGRILQQRSMLTEGEPDLFLNRLADSIEGLVKGHFPKARFAAVGVSLPGLIDRETGSIVSSPNLEWNNVPVRSLLHERLKLPVFVENDANAAAFSELWYGPLSEASIGTLLFVLVVEGLGTGLIINRELRVGPRFGLGGFGHMSIDPNGELCSCGRRGCWETFASERATVERFHRVTAKQGLPFVGIQELIARAKNGDEMALESIKITAEYLGEGISNLVHGIYPEAVVIGGNITAAWPIIEPILRKRLKSKYIVDPDQILIRPASVQRPSLFGAIPIALQNYFRSANSPLAVSAGNP
ncbi:MAG TPA: ROK family transcriptional regulator [Pyrinomonadaceae bacterium]|jgi:predicted NBD/HSP70 family sugar kinase|nr:ROK family transcriptional regulator [Pyrinomonadaceae bacterium]